MKKIISILTIAGLTAALLAGCGSNGTSGKTEETPSATAAAASASGTVSTDGSTSMEKVMGYLSEAYMGSNPDTKVTYNPTGSGSGIKAVQEGRCDIGLSSRDLKDDEKTTLDGTVVAIDGIAIIVNPQNQVSDLTIAQIASLYKGEVTNWKDVGGADSPVVLIGREAASGTRDGFESITDTKDTCKYSQELTSTGDVIQTVASNPNAIGYASLASVKDTVKTVNVEGVTPTTETIQDGTYKIQRDFVFVTKKDAQLSESAKAFFDFATSPEADSLIEKAGAVPVASNFVSGSDLMKGVYKHGKSKENSRLS